MAARLSTSAPPFPPLEMADSERDRIEYLAYRLVRKTLADYDAHRQAGSKVDTSAWNLVRRCEQLAMYKRIGPSALYNAAIPPQQATSIWSRSESVSVGEALSRPRHKMPELLQVGAIRGTLNEVMYGTIAVDRTAMMLKTAYTDDTLLEGETLCQLRGPSAAHPFRFLGVKWAVKGTPHIVRAPMVRPRDLVYIEATGILIREGSNERVGYHLMHSVSVPGYGPLDDRKIVRGEMSSCILFMEVPGPTDVVEVYMKGQFEPNGSVSESVATLSASLGLMYCAKINVCAQNKKLSWLLRSNIGSSGHPKSSGMCRQRSCPICTKVFTMFSGTATCEVCSTVVCSGCSVKKKIGFAKTGSKRVIMRTIGFCTSCLTHARRMDNFEVARQELLAGSGVCELESSAMNYKVTEPLPGAPNCRSREIRSKAKAQPFIGTKASTTGIRNSDIVELKEIEEFEESLMNKDPPTLLDQRAKRSNTYPTPCPATARGGTPQDEIMARIIAMRNAAEDAYQTTRKNARAIEMISIARNSSAVS